MRDPITTLNVGDRIGIYRKSNLRGTGTILRKLNANDDMMWGHKMAPDWILTIDVDGLGPRKWRDGMFAARDLGRIGYVKLKPIDPTPDPEAEG